MKAKPRRIPDVNKATLSAIVVNAIQIAALAAFVLYVLLWREQSRLSLTVIVVIAALMAAWGASIDIQEAVRTRRRERTISELQLSNGQMDALNLKLRAQRHDFLNHLQVVYSLLEMGESNEAADYLETIYNQLKSVSKVLRTRVTAFNALLQVKNAACEEKGIALEMDIRSTLDGLTVPAWELCCIIGNLMDNAMDAVGGMRDGRIWLNVREDLHNFYFTVRNNGAPVPEELRQSIFEPGVSTKGEGRGMGLSIVRQTLAEFGGTIALEDGGETAFTVTVPKGNRL
ncbi:MAG: ATP-binding protein [Candidatus Limiplasma sp.]|nr:ATP-binding protein [Candidatus Limiplasma sp.]